MNKIKITHWNWADSPDVYETESFKFPGGEIQVGVPGLPSVLSRFRARSTPSTPRIPSSPRRSRTSSDMMGDFVDAQ